MGWDRNPRASRARTFDEAVALPLGQREAHDLAHWSDDSLMAAVVARDVAAFSALYDRYAGLVYTTALRVLRDPQLAEDTAQEIFVRLWQRPEAFIPARGRFATWLLSITRNRAVDEVRARGRRRRREVEEREEQPLPLSAPEEVDPIHLAEVREEQRAVRAALATLPPEQRRVLELAYFGGLTHQEISAALREPLGTVKTRIRLGMQKLRAALERYQ